MTEQIETSTHVDPFTPVPNYIINDPTLSAEAKLTWIFLFSKRNIPGWKVHPRHVQKMLRFKDFVWRRVYKELNKDGYLTSRKVQGGTVTTFVWDWDMKTRDFKPALTAVDKAGDKL